MIFSDKIPLANEPQSGSILSVFLGILNMETLNKEDILAELVG